MKISAWHKQNGDQVEWTNNLLRYDRVYAAKVFDWSTEDPTVIQCEDVVRGGTGYDKKNKLPPEIECQYPDYSLYGVKEAYGFLTRGCPRGCGFCIVQEKEGPVSTKVADLSQFWNGQKEIKLLDPNLLACKHHADLIGQLVDSKAWVDFTQGLDARFITDKNAALLARVKTKMVHFAWDKVGDEKAVMRGLAIYKEIARIDAGDTGIYVLTNYNSTHAEDVYRCERIKEAGYMPFIMIYDKAHSPRETRDLQRWCNNRRIYKSCTFAEYRKGLGR